MRSHLTAFGIGAGLSLFAAGALALFAPKLANIDDEGDGIHVVNIGKGDNGSFHLKDDASDLSADWKGDFEFAADGRSLTLLKGALDITSKANGVVSRAAFKKDGAAIVTKFYRDDDLVSDAAGAPREAADLLQLFARSSGVNADGRIKALIAAGGKEAAIAEIGDLRGSHAVGSYVESLATQAALTNDDILALIERVKDLDSDYAKRSALSALLAAPEIGDPAIEAIIGVARSIEGDHEIRLIIEDIAERPMSPKSFSIASRLLDEIEGDHEVRLAVEAMLESKSISADDAARAIDIGARLIDGDYEIRLVIEAAEERMNDAAVGAAAIRALSAIESGHERRLAIEEVAGALDEASTQWPALIAAGAAVSGDHEKRLTIEAIKGEAPDTDEIRAALRKAASEIGSEHERRLALESLE